MRGVGNSRSEKGVVESGEDTTISISRTLAEKERFREGSKAWKDKGETSERKATDQVLSEHDGRYTREYEIHGPC